MRRILNTTQGNNMKEILLTHGSGGKLTHSLIKGFLKILGNEYLNELDDSAIFNIGNNKIAFTTDSYVVKPIFFPGGDIGRLAVCGTVNDLAVCGARPLFLSSSMIIEEGFPERKLDRILRSMSKTAEEAGVKIVTGDTKVVEKGACDGIFITTSGVGIIEANFDLSISRINPGDKVIISGNMGDHGFSVLNAREKFEFKADIRSDASPLNGLISAVMKIGKDIKFMRDPTRGGLATTLNEIVENKNIGIEIFDEKIPVNKKVAAIGEILGIDPLYMGNEGKAVFVTSERSSQAVLRRLRKHKFGKNASIIGIVTKENKGKVILRTKIGTRRMLGMLIGEQLPRIC